MGGKRSPSEWADKGNSRSTCDLSMAPAGEVSSPHCFRENNATAPVPTRASLGRPNVNRALMQGLEEEAVLRAWQL